MATVVTPTPPPITASRLYGLVGRFELELPGREIPDTCDQI
jgi:hypothetical protein